MKSKLKRTHHHQTQQQQQQQVRTHAKTLSILPVRHISNDQERRISDFASMNQELRFSTPPARNYSMSINPTLRRSLKNYPKYSTQSTSESETTASDLPMIASIYVSIDNDETTKTILENDGKSPLTSL